MSQRWGNDWSTCKRSSEKERKMEDMTNRTLNSDSVSKSIVRGRAALAEAENHIKMFEDFLENSLKKDKSYGFQMNEYVAEEEISPSQSVVFLDEPYDSSPGDLVYSTVKSPKVINDMDDVLSMSLINEMMKEGERRQQRDNAIMAARCEGNNFLKSTTRKQNDREKVKSLKKRNFDPRNLSVAKRAIVKTAITAQEIAHNEAEMKKKSQFKARPLPGGNFVKNDPYALTKAALGKVSRGHISDSSMLPSQNTRLDASLLLNRSQSHSCPRICSEHSRIDIAKPQHRMRKHETMKKAVYDQISETIETMYNEDLNQSDEEVSSEDEQHLATLHQQISKLQAELNIKRIQCIKTIEEIDKYSPESYPELFDRENDLSNAITDNIGEKVSNSEWCEDNGEKSLIYEENELQANALNSKKPDHVKIQYRKNNKKGKRSSSLYDRHCLWLKMREEKRMEAKSREEKELVKDVTGKPNLHGAKKSWIKAKQQHDGLMKSIEMKDVLRKAEKDEKERQLRQKHVTEIERLQILAKEKNREGKCGIDKRKQSEYIDKLARPNSRLKVESKVKVQEISKEKLNEPTTEKETKESTNSVKEENTGVNLSFADMDDKEFSKMIRKLKAKASKGKCTTFGNQEDNNDSLSDALIGRSVKENSLDKSNNECDENEKEGNKIDGNFTSSIAQAKIYAEISGTKGESSDYGHDSKTQQIETTIREDDNLFDKQKHSFPYERYDAGDVPFFDKSSSSERGRFRVHDAREFHTDSLRRVPVPFDASSCDGVMFLVGKRNHQKDQKEDVVTILFDRSKFDEKSASAWWQLNRHQII